jgi:hypothetical protein
VRRVLRAPKRRCSNVGCLRCSGRRSAGGTSGDPPTRRRRDLFSKRASRTPAENRHKGFFIVRRTRTLGELHPELLTDPSHAQLIARVTEDFNEVEAFLNQIFSGPKSLLQIAPDGPSGAAVTAPFTCDPDKHLDLANVAAIFTGHATSRSSSWITQGRDLRRSPSISTLRVRPSTTSLRPVPVPWPFSRRTCDRSSSRSRSTVARRPACRGTPTLGRHRWALTWGGDGSLTGATVTPLDASLATYRSELSRTTVAGATRH